ncbi:BACON domain-containing protein [Mangrovibacterium lignilyticum]|uniref:BACON domain-containing protein n=1 Tax=Mangrovibacterium lignilyticum TaxID=2668052 RepID=UPI0013CF546F|nr:BACON domain-containing protein [Mangrovibacterium lignilyticum]
MKELKIILTVLVIFSSICVFTSCSDDDEVIIKATLELEKSETTVPYTAGSFTVGVSANNEYSVTVDETGTDWLTYEIVDSGDSLNVSYIQNDSTLVRTSRLIVINDDVMRFLYVDQEGFPSSSITTVDLNYTVTTGGGYTILSVPDEDCDQIPIGSTVVFECGESGSISFLDASYTEFAGGIPVNGTFSFVWTQEIANITAGSGITTGILRDGFEVTGAYAMFSKTSLEYSINEGGGYTIFSVSAEECEKIPIGATLDFSCPSDNGTISLLDATYAEYAGGSPVNGKFSFSWTNGIAATTAESGITTGVLRDGFDISSLFFIDMNTDLEYSIVESGGYTIFSVSLEECAKIPIGATVVLECPSDAGTISLLDATYTEYAGGSPVNGEFSFVWTKEIAAITATSGITTGILRDGFDVSSMRCHN